VTKLLPIDSAENMQKRFEIHTKMPRFQQNVPKTAAPPSKPTKIHIESRQRSQKRLQNVLWMPISFKKWEALPKPPFPERCQKSPLDAHIFQKTPYLFQKVGSAAPVDAHIFQKNHFFHKKAAFKKSDRQVEAGL